MFVFNLLFLYNTSFNLGSQAKMTSIPPEIQFPSIYDDLKMAWLDGAVYSQAMSVSRSISDITLKTSLSAPIRTFVSCAGHPNNQKGFRNETSETLLIN